MRVSAAPAPKPAGGAESTPRRLGPVAIMIGWSLLIQAVGFFVSGLVAFAILPVVAESER